MFKLYRSFVCIIKASASDVIGATLRANMRKKKKKMVLAGLTYRRTETIDDPFSTMLAPVGTN